MAATSHRAESATRWTRARIGRVVAAPLLAAAVAVVPAAGSQARTPVPGLRFIVGAHHMTVQRFADEPVLFLDGGAYLASTNGTFELDAVRSHHGISIWQVSRSHGTTHRLRRILPDGHVHFDRGLPNFLVFTLRDKQGHVVKTSIRSFCPVADVYSAARVGPTGPPNPTFPSYCGDQLTRATVWGINDGWAVPIFSQLRVSQQDAPDGSYTLQIAIAKHYARQLHLTSAQSQATFSLTIVTDSGGGCPPKCVGGAARRTTTRSGGVAPRPTGSGRAEVPRDGLPDLAALPAGAFMVEHNKPRGRDYLDFAATIWDRGPGPLDVEGFRHGQKPTMTARQFVYRNGRQVSAPVIGTFEFDSRLGHHHWHLADFARYDLLSASGKELVRSHKQSFCLAPTNTINMLLKNAEWQPDRIGLGSSCPSDQSIWLRESLPVGWGDTYDQTVAGQSFSISGLANGIYLVRVITNPRHRILETTTKNNESLVKIQLGGVPGARTVQSLGPVPVH
ncbi:MAG: hypothetical protein JO222_07570 [Frankiales bacterium]|nr:hypothetical protein [Frankiales bacterium]